MVRFVPNIEIDEIANKPERDVARALRDQLPQDCVVYHSYPWLNADRHDRNRKTTLKEGEVDFVVVLPSHGVLVLEVKGGQIQYEAENRGWYRIVGKDDIRPIQDPLEQARRNTHYLIDQIKQSGYPGKQDPPFAYGYAAVFPDCNYTGPAPPGAESIILFSADDLPYLERRIRDALRSWSRAAEPYRLQQEDKAAIQKAISPAFQLMPALYRQVDEEEEKLVRLTDQQAYMLTFIDQRPRAAIQGVAGSGKTMLARAQAQRFADRGLSVLFTCFNKGLAHWLQDTLPADYSEQITVRHFHGLCDEWCQEAGIPFDPDNHDPATFWREIAPNRLMDALDIIQRRFDAIVVDEGQDFHPDWWVPLEALNTKAQAGPLYVFFDPAQNLFVDREWNLPDIDGEPYVLERNCRNTRLIAQTCGEIIEKLIETHELAPEGTETIFRTAQTNREQIQVCGEILKDWVGQGQLQYQQIAILSPLTKPKSSLAAVDDIGKFPIINDIGAWQNNEGILFSTIRSFKGLEADAVILIDAAEPDTKPYFKRPDYYVACSRAKHRLAVIRKEAD